MKRIKRFLIELWNLLRLPEMLILPGNLAFFLFYNRKAPHYLQGFGKQYSKYSPFIRAVFSGNGSFVNTDKLFYNRQS